MKILIVEGVAGGALAAGTASYLGQHLAAGKSER